MRMPEPQQWSLDAVRAVAATPWANSEASMPEVIHFQPGEGLAPAEREMQVRRVYIRQADLDEFGYTQGCRRCQHILTYGPNKGTMPHSDECRARITAALRQTDHGRARLERIEAREDRFLFDHIQKHDAANAPAPQGSEEGAPQDVVQVPGPAGAKRC